MLWSLAVAVSDNMTECQEVHVFCQNLYTRVAGTESIAILPHAFKFIARCFSQP